MPPASRLPMGVPPREGRWPYHNGPRQVRVANGGAPLRNFEPACGVNGSNQRHTAGSISGGDAAANRKRELILDRC